MIDTQTEDYDFNKFIEIDKTLLSQFGLYPRRQNSYILYCLGAFLNASLTYCQVVLFGINMYMHRNDIQGFSEVLLIFLTYATYGCKMTNLFYYKNNLIYVEKLLSSHLFKKFQPQQVKFIKKRTESCNRVVRGYRALCTFSAIMHSSVPFFSKSGTLPAWLLHSDKYYFLMAIFQFFCICNIGHNNTGVDIITWKLFTTAAAQFDVLLDSLKNIDFDTDKPQLAVSDAREKLQNCINHYSDTVSLVNVIESTMSKGIFAQFFSSVIIISTTGFALVTVPFLGTSFRFLVMYASGMLFQIGMYCWYGHQVLIQSSDLGISLHMSNWYESDMKVRKSIMILLERTKRPVQLTAGNVIILSIPTFAAIIRSSYSYFTLLQNISLSTEN